MKKQIKKFEVVNYSETGLLILDADLETISKVTEFISKLNAEIHTPKNDTNDDKR